MWEYLDKMEKNMLYIYASALANPGKRIRFCGQGEREVSNYELYQRTEEDRRNVFYLFWFVYRHILQCETLEQALAVPPEEALQKYRLKSLFRYLYIGIDKDVALYEKDLPIVLEILYLRLGFWEQLDLFIERTEKGCRQMRCIQMKERYEAMCQASMAKKEEG